MIGWFEPPRESFQIAVNEALLLSNNKEVRDKLLRDDGLLRAILEAQGTSKQVDLLVRAVLGRPPHAEEERWLTAHIEARKERAAEAWRQVLWSLLTSSEFRFNH